MYILRTSFSVTTLKMKDEFHWEGIYVFYVFVESTKGNVISSYFWGYIVPQIPAGIIAMKYGARYILVFIKLFNRWILGLGFMISALVLYFVPLAAKESTVLYI